MEGIKEAHSTTLMDDLFADFKCSICLEVFIDATMTSCRHLYCGFCINKWLQFSTKCPQCLSAISKCTPIQNIDDQIDGIFRSLPQSIRDNREEVKQRRRKLEKDDTDGSVQPFNTTIDKLRGERANTKIHLSASEEKWLEKLSPYIKQAYPSLSSTSTSCLSEETRDDKDKLPRLVSTDLHKDFEKNENVRNNNNNNNSGHLKYENLKLPPIKLIKSIRQVRGITTSTSPQQQMTEDFPGNMEGDIQQTDSCAEGSIRELERRNRVLEDQLFGAYDRIIDNIKENNDTLAKAIPLDAFSNNTKNGTPMKHSNTVLNNNNNSSNNSNNNNNSKSVNQQNELQQLQNFDSNGFCDQDPANSIHDVNDLLQETEELMEIENFLKEFPFERIRDDEDLIGYISDYDNEEINLDLLDSDHIENISAHRSLKLNPKRKLTKDQEIIENFYKKLESKRPVHVTGTTNGVNPLIGGSSKTGGEKTSGQAPPCSKSKRPPLLNKLPLNQNFTTTANSSKSNTTTSTTSKVVSNSLLNPSLGHSQSISKKISRVSKTNNSNGKKANDSNRITIKNTPALNVKNTVSSTLPKLNTVNNPKPTLQPEKVKIDSTASEHTLAVNSNDQSITQTGGEISIDSALELDYEDFKLEVDFLDGNGDWRKFKSIKTPEESNAVATTNFNSSSKKLLPLLQAKEAELKKNTSNIMFPSVKTVRKNQNATTQKKKKCIIVTQNNKSVGDTKDMTQQAVIKQNPSQKSNNRNP